jgi:hypothetical protein
LVRQKNAGHDQIDQKETVTRDNETKRAGGKAPKSEPRKNADGCGNIKSRVMCGVLPERVQDEFSMG